MSDETYLTVAEAAARIKTSDEMVRRMLREGRLRGKRLGGPRAGWRVAASEVEQLLAPSPRPVPGPVPRRLRPAPPSPLSDQITHALYEASLARREGNESEAARWMQRAHDLAASSEA